MTLSIKTIRLYPLASTTCFPGKILLRYVVVQLLSRVWFFVRPWTAACQASCPSPSPGACSNSSPLNRWCHPTISSSVTAFFSRLQSFPTSGFFPMSWLLASGDQSIRVSALASVLAVNIQGWFSLEWTGWISLQSNGLSRVFSSTTILSLIYGPTLTSAHNCNCSFI